MARYASVWYNVVKAYTKENAMNIPIRKLYYVDSQLDGPLWYARKIPAGQKAPLDFYEIKFLRPEAVILMIVISEMFYKRTGESVGWINLSPDEKSYLERINISQLEFIDVPKPERLWFRSKSPSKHLFELQRINDPTQLGEITTRTKDILKTWFPDNIKGSMFYNDAALIIMEIVNNTIEHSVSDYTKKPGTCYFTIQQYQPPNSPNPKVIIAFGDAGMGIRNSLQRANEWVPNNDLYALKKVLLEGGVTARMDGSGGLGLKSIVELLEKHGGAISVRTGYNSIYYEPQTQSLRTKKFREAIVGTQTSIVL